MSIKTLLCSFYKSSAAMQQKAVASVVILSGLACVCIRALLCEPVSAPGGHSPSLLPQGALLVDPGLLISPQQPQYQLTKCSLLYQLTPCSHASAAWPDLSTPEHTSLLSKP